MYRTILPASLLASLLPLVSPGAAGQVSAPPGSTVTHTPGASGTNPEQSSEIPPTAGTPGPGAGTTPGERSPQRPYSEFDANRDGTISAEEYRKISPDAPYSSIDLNGDGKVSEKEYRDSLQKRTPMGNPPSTTAPTAPRN